MSPLVAFETCAFFPAKIRFISDTHSIIADKFTKTFKLQSEDIKILCFEHIDGEFSSNTCVQVWIISVTNRLNKKKKNREGEKFIQTSRNEEFFSKPQLREFSLAHDKISSCLNRRVQLFIENATCREL